MFIDQSEYTVHLTARAEEAAPLDPLVRKLRSFSDLPSGWSHGEGAPVDSAVVGRAERFLAMASILQIRADVFPGLHGECSVALYERDASIEIIVKPDDADTYGLHVERGQGFQFTTVLEDDTATLEATLTEVRRMVPDAWSSSESSPSDSTIPTRDGFRILFSSNRLVRA